jgi:formyl-CoA transferase
VQDIDEVCADPAVRDKFLRSVDPQTGFEVTMAPPPVTTPWLRDHDRTMTFPPRHGEHNQTVYGAELGLAADELAVLRAEGVI